MPVTDLPVVSMLKTRMHWQQTRQKVLAQNVANATTPGFVPRDLQAPDAAPSLMPVQTNPLHLVASEAGAAASRDAQRFETRPSGNAVSLEDEMLKVAETQADYQLAASLYQKSLAMLRTASGGKS